MTLLLPCRACETLGRPDNVPPHASSQHLIMWATFETDAKSGVPAWQLILSAPLPPEWRAPRSRNVDVIVAALPPDCRVIWSSLERPA